MSREESPFSSGFNRVWGLAQSLFAKQLVDYVDPFIGTDGTGHTFPGPSRPFGMVQPGPDNAGGGWAFTWAINISRPSLVAFHRTGLAEQESLS